MTADHLAWAIWQGFSTNPVALVMHILGRLTCPIMCYIIAEGYHYTKNLKKYIGRMFLFAVISHFPYVFCSFNYIDPLSFVPFAHGSPFNQTGVLWAFAWGLGTEKEVSKALYWTERAANHGDRDAQSNLASFYEEGIGVEIDIEKAKFWYKKSALQGHDLAVEKCKELGVDLA